MKHSGFGQEGEVVERICLEEGGRGERVRKEERSMREECCDQGSRSRLWEASMVMMLMEM